jgi:hypothetical protein
VTKYLTKLAALQMANFASEPDLLFPIPGWDGDYEIIISGKVRNVKTGHVLKTAIRRCAVRYNVACSIGHVHRLSASALLGLF